MTGGAERDSAAGAARGPAAVAAGGSAAVAVVTGAGRGIGRATALRLARDGFDLALCALERSEVEAVAAEVRALGRRVHAAAFDVAEPGAIDAFLDAVRAELGPAFALVANAGTILLPDDVAHADPARWDRTMAVNARAPYLFATALLPAMVDAGRGRIVTLASTAGLGGLPDRLCYVASKHAVVGLTRALAEDARRTPVTVNAVCPGAVRTRLTEGSRPGDDRAGWLEADEVAATIAHLVGPDGGHVHGAVIELRDRG